MLLIALRPPSSGARGTRFPLGRRTKTPMRPAQAQRPQCFYPGAYWYRRRGVKASLTKNRPVLAMSSRGWGSEAIHRENPVQSHLDWIHGITSRQADPVRHELLRPRPMVGQVDGSSHLPPPGRCAAAGCEDWGGSSDARGHSSRRALDPPIDGISPLTPHLVSMIIH